MMKSFFKKLAFVMALAMVVTLAAPAGSAFAAETGIAVQNTTEALASDVIEAVDVSKDYCFLGAPKDWKTQGWTWASSNEDVATVDRAGLVTTTGYGETVISITVGDSYKEEMTLTVKAAEEELDAVQTSVRVATVTFTEDHSFNVKGEEGANEATLEVANSVKIYRVFATDEAANMDASAFDFMDAEGNGYQAHYIKEVKGKDNVWTIEGYNMFKDNAKYAVVYGPNNTSSELEGIVDFFTAHIGKATELKISATQATVENEIEGAIPAELKAKLYNAYGIDVTELYEDVKEATEYELVDESTELSVNVSGYEVTFDEPGKVEVLGTYTYYDEDKEEDVPLTATTWVEGVPYSTYTIDEICAWTITAPNAAADWGKIKHDMIAGDDGQLYVIVKDNRGNYYTNAEGTTKYNNKDVVVLGDGESLFEQYGYSLVFDSLDPDSLLVDYTGYTNSYKQTKSFAVVSYVRDMDGEIGPEVEIGVMGINVKAPRVLDDVTLNKTSFKVLKETEAEEGVQNFWKGYTDFSLSDTLTRKLLNQYDEEWGANAEDYLDVTPSFTVTTSKKDFEIVAENIATALDNGEAFTVDYENVFGLAGSEATSVTFKIKETVTGKVSSVTIKLDVPRYDEETGYVYVDPNRAVLTAGNVELYTGSENDVKLFQVSKANQKVGYFRAGTDEYNDDYEYEKDLFRDRNYYVANELTSKFTVDGKATLGETEVTFVTDLTATASGSAASGSALASGTALDEGDLILVVTDPNGKVVPAVGFGGYGKAVDEFSNLGIKVSTDGKNAWYELVVAAENTKGELEYAAVGTYRVNVYRVTGINTSKGDNPVTKYNVAKVVGDSFTVTKDFRAVTFYHQSATKTVADLSSFDTYEDVLLAISKTMEFRLNGEKVTVDEAGKGTYKSYYHKDKLARDIEIVEVDYTIQKDGERAVINTVTFKVWTDAGNYYTSKVKVNRSVNADVE